MDKAYQKISRRYAKALRRYLKEEQELLLEHAYDLGRQAVAEGLGVLDMARLHQEVLAMFVLSNPKPMAHAQVLESAEDFFLEALSPFEVTHRGFREANQSLQQLIQTLKERNEELARINGELELEVSERKRTENALRLSEQALRDLSNRLLHVQEEERKRLSRELHDEVGQALTAINVNLTVLGRNDAGDAPAFQRKVADTQQLLEQTMETVHRFAHELRPALLDDLGLLPALRSYSKSFAERTGIPVHFNACDQAEKLSPEQKVVVFRLVQESLNNVAKHARASRVELTLAAEARHVQLCIQDNGRSFNAETVRANPTKRLGLLGMQERVRLVNGRLVIEAQPGQGTAVRAEIPLKGR